MTSFVLCPCMFDNIINCNHCVPYLCAKKSAGFSAKKKCATLACTLFSIYLQYCHVHMWGSAVTVSLLYLVVMAPVVARGQSKDDRTASSLFPCGSGGGGCSPDRQEVCLLSILSGQSDQQAVAGTQV